jgi:hypothetical protein
MKSQSRLFPVFAVFVFLFPFYSSGQNSVNPKYSIASPEYEQITEQYLQHLARFEWEASYAFLADDVAFHMPDGDRGSRTMFKGLDAVKAHWDSYVERSGNDKASFTQFVHVPVQVNAEVKNIGREGVFNVCYFSAELSYGSHKANVRMNWTIHFNKEKKIDGIYCYYDRTPIVEAANKNFLASDKNTAGSENLVVQYIRLQSDLSEPELLQIANERADGFRAIPGLIQKYYVRLNEPGQYGGIYIWRSKKDLTAFRNSELAASIPQVYQVVGPPKVEVSDLLFQLRK